MWLLKLALLGATYRFCAADLYEELRADTPNIFAPQDLGYHLERQLASNGSRFLSRPCFQHLLEYAKGLITLKFWALSMFDASAKFPSGVLRGYGGGLGTFKQCIQIKSKNENVGTINGKYCLGLIELINANKKSRIGNYTPHSLSFQHNEVTEPHSRLVSLSQLSVGLPWGVCLPDACSAADFQVLHFLFFLKFREDYCQTEANQVKDFDNSDICAITFFGLIACLMVWSTMYDVYVYYRKQSTPCALLSSFSILTNGKKVFEIVEDETDTSCVYGIKSLNLLLFIVALRFGMHLFAPLNNWLDLTKFILDRKEIFELLLVFDTFFVSSGMLLSYNYLKCRARGIKFNILCFYLKRIVRYTPPLAVLLLFHTTLLRHIGSGPVWPRTRKLMVENCENSWWYNILYIQNYLNPDLRKICVLQTWQISVEMQLFLLSPLLLIPLVKHPKYAVGCTVTLLFCSMASSFLFVWMYNLKSAIPSFRSLDDVGKYFKYFFMATHIRASVWLVGFVAGVLTFKSNKINIHIKKEVTILVLISLWAAALGIFALCVVIGKNIADLSYYNWIDHAVHMSLIHPFWALAVVWIIFACIRGYGGPINVILSSRLFRIISRISYSTNIVTLSMMSILTYQTETGVEFNPYLTLYKACSDIAICLSVGFIWTIAFQFPFIAVYNCLEEKLKNKNVAELINSNKRMYAQEKDI